MSILTALFDSWSKGSWHSLRLMGLLCGHSYGSGIVCGGYSTFGKASKRDEALEDCARLSCLTCGPVCQKDARGFWNQQQSASHGMELWSLIETRSNSVSK